MTAIDHLLQNNRHWSDDIRARDSHYFERLAGQQKPPYLWIGCSDSRVPANIIIGLDPGEVFVHRNIANLVKDADMNCLSVIQYAVEVLRVEHIIVTGHYGCGGVTAAVTGQRAGLVDNWIGEIRNTCRKHDHLLSRAPDMPARIDRACELNVIEQVAAASRTTVVQDAWQAGQRLTVHGWIYGLRDGLIHDLKVSISGPDEISERYGAAVAARGHTAAT
ncbi:MAG TPA: carbonate dehydratase [Burkholderiales bacterium]|jgi:carbonic anhydrase|nr:carbonate dehydratase [Burkholderiales bacterium]